MVSQSSLHIYLYGIFWGMTFKTMEIMLLYIKKYRKEVVQNVEWFPYANFFPAWSIQSMFLNIARKIDSLTECLKEVNVNFFDKIR